MESKINKLKKKYEKLIDEFDSTKDWNRKIQLWGKLDILQDEIRELESNVLPVIGGNP